MKRKRTKPYSGIGIRRIPCSRCGAASAHQWQVCADGNQYRGICLECDIDLNRIVLEFFKIPNRGELMNEYERKTRLNA